MRFSVDVLSIRICKVRVTQNSTCLCACNSYLDVVNNVIGKRFIKSAGIGVEILGHFDA